MRMQCVARSKVFLTLVPGNRSPIERLQSPESLKDRGPHSSLNAAKNGAIVYRDACKLGCEGMCLSGAIQIRPLAALGEDQEPGGAGR